MSISALLVSIGTGLVECVVVVFRLLARRKNLGQWNGEVVLLLRSGEHGHEKALGLQEEVYLEPHEELLGFRLINAGLQDDLKPVIEEYFGENFLEPNRYPRFVSEPGCCGHTPFLDLRLRFPAGQTEKSPEHRVLLILKVTDDSPPVVVEVFWNPIVVVGQM